MLVCVPHAPVTKEARRQHKIPGARVIDNCEPPRGAIRDSTPQGKERDPTKCVVQKCQGDQCTTPVDKQATDG